MPKAAVDEDDLSPLGENYVWSAGQYFPVETVAESHAMDETADRDFSPTVAVLDRAHGGTSLFGSFHHLRSLI